MTEREQKLLDSLLGTDKLYPNKDFKVRPGGRSGKIMDLDAFKTSFTEFCEKRGLDIYEIFYEDYFQGDQKVMFDYENVEEEDSGTLRCGVPWILYYAGGDWEEPVYFFIYPDGKTGNPRMYIPTRGNIFHKGLKVAYGSIEEKMPELMGDFDGAIKEMFRDMVKSVNLSDGYSKSEIENVVSEIFNNDDARENFRLDYNTVWMIDELETRIKGIL